MVPEAAQWVALRLVPGLSDSAFRRLLAEVGPPEQIFSAGVGTLAPITGEAVAQAIARGPDPAALAPTLKWLEDPANAIVTLADPDYPLRLLHIPDPPPLLYVKGRRDRLSAPAIAVVGSRNATPQGLANAEAFSRALSDAGLTIVSGLAVGIDAADHRGGLAGGAKSLAVTGTGLDRVYPAANQELAHRLAAEGALVSEFPLGAPAKAAHFPRRNRILSGLSLGCLVVEAALQSGSLITARLAAEQGREVFAIPGSIHSPLSKGCHALIKQGAKLVECAQDVLEELSLASVAHPPAGNAPSHPLLECLGFDAADVDTLCQRSGLPTDRVAALLLELELQGRVAPLPGGLYQRLR